MSPSQRQCPRRRLRIGLLVLAFAAASAGCGSQEASPERTASQEPGSAADVAYLLDDVRDRHSSVDGFSVAKNLPDALPNRRYSIAGGEPVQVSSAVVRGTVVDAEPGAGYQLPNGDAESGTAIDFFDKRALWRLITVTLDVSESVGADVGDTTRFALASSSPDAERLLRGAAALGEVAVVLEPAGTVKHDPTVHRVAQWGGALAQVATDGTLTFAVDAKAYPAFLGGLTTWEALRKDASRPLPAVEVDARFRRT